MYSKILIKGIIENTTGLHIGTGGEYSAIGTADLPVVRDVIKHLPMIPGSSLKGKIRTLLARKYNPNGKSHFEDPQSIVELFGGKKQRGALIFSDLFINSSFLDELREIGIYSTTEIKFENTINRMTSVANPRQIERVIRGCKFDLDMICDVKSSEEAVKYISLLAEGFKLLQLDYLGGSGSRGYGRVRFSELEAKCVLGELPADIMEKCNAILKGVETS